jgi:uncharacterized membrane protein YfcA
MDLDPWVSFAGAIVGFVVGLTGMGGGALMTPILVIVFGVQPLTAVSSDLVAAVIMKPVGGGVHLRRGTVHMDMVKWLCIGSVPAAFCGVLVLESLGSGKQLQDRISTILGVALLVAALAIQVKALIQRGRIMETEGITSVKAKPLPLIAIGLLGGLIVGMTSVGSGSLMIVLILLLYPTLRASHLVGTDLVQAVPLVAAAALGHILYGDFQLGLTVSLLIGSIPGVYLGARVSSVAPDHIIRPVLTIVLALSGLKLLGLSNSGLGTFMAIGVAVLVVYWFVLWRKARGSRVDQVVSRHPEVVDEAAFE